MPFAVKGKIEGLEGVVAKLRDLSAKVQKKALKKAVNDASRVLLWSARARVPRRKPKSLPKNVAYKGGQMKRALGRKVKVYGGTAVGVVGARLGEFRIQVGLTTRAGKRQPAGSPIFVNPVKYLHLIELGTKKVRGTHFLRDAMDSNRSAIRDAFRDAVESAIREATA